MRIFVTSRHTLLVRRRLRTAGLAALTAVLALAARAQDGAWRFTDVSRIVVVGDVHGAYDALTGLLEEAGVVDDRLRWIGGDTHLVSLGDLLDRGPDSRAVMDLLMRLQGEAEAAGGQVHVVLGNHELMNLMGDLRYTSGAEFAAFADEEPAGARRAAHERFAAEHEDSGAATLEAEFEQRYPPGYFGHRAAFRPQGRYGAWLLSLPALVVVDGTAFVHGGLPELVAREGLATVNGRIHDTLGRYLELRADLAAEGVLPPYDMEHDIELAERAREASTTSGEVEAELAELVELAGAPELGIEGPVWYRGSVYCNAITERPVLEAGLEKLGASAVVVGHTPTGDRRVRALYGGELVMLDTGMLADYYAGHPAVLVIEGGQRRVRYLDDSATGAPETGAPLAYGRTEPELLALLASAAVESSEAPGADVVELDANGTAVEARFYGPDGDAAGHELAAYTLDRLLGLDLVPPTVARTLDGRTGALQLRFPGSVSENDRLERRLPFGWCPIEPQVGLMRAFDLLTFNTGRTRATLRYRNDLTNLVLVDHARAFGTQRELPNGLDEAPLPAALVESLRELDESGLESSLGAWLSRREIRALLARRDELLELNSR